MRMIPNAVPASTSSNAERKVFDLLRETQIEGAICFHSLRLHHHREKVSSEADFVVVSRRGVILLEVKGGRIQQRAGGWVSIDRHGNASKPSEGPFRQGETAMYALRDRLEELVGERIVRDLPFGFAVVTPDCNLPTNTVEWGPEIVLDAGRLRGATELSRPLAQLIEHWRDRRSVSAHAQVTTDELAEVVAACRPDFDAIPSLRARSEETVAAMVTATEAQYRVLDVVGLLERVVVTGGAGTGKTWIAMEAARRQADAGHRVLVTCHARTLAGWLRSQLPDRVEVVSHSALGQIRGRFDVLIVDEAQDLMTEQGLGHLDAAVTGGLDRGSWMIFMDPQHQAGLRGDFDAGVFDLVLDRCSTDAPLVLADNLRNTAYIVAETAMLTGADLGRPHVQGGGPVVTRYADDPVEEAAVLRSWLKDLRREEMPSGAVTILTPGDPRALHARLPEADQRRLRSVGGTGAATWPLSETTMCSVPEFKGLENDVVVLADLWQLDPIEQISLLYVAMTRARVELRVIWPATRRDQLDCIRLDNAKRMGGT